MFQRSRSSNKRSLLQKLVQGVQDSHRQRLAFYKFSKDFGVFSGQEGFLRVYLDHSVQLPGPALQARFIVVGAVEVVSEPRFFRFPARPARFLRWRTVFRVTLAGFIGRS